MYDLKLIPIHQEKGQPIPQQVGFMAASPPRRAVRSRSEDLLILSFTMRDENNLSAELQESWLSKLVDTFFKTSGSVTSALRSLIETLNLTLMEKNLKSAKSGAPVTGAINLAAIHHRVAYLTQSGLTHAYALTQAGVAHFYDASQTDRGLGLSRTPTIRYYQAELGSGGYLFMTDTPPETWTDDQLCMDGLPNLVQLRRRLLNQASPNLRLDLVQLTPGEGYITTVSTPVPALETNDQVEILIDQDEETTPPEETAPQEEIPPIEAVFEPEAAVVSEGTPDALPLEIAFEDTQKVPQTLDVEKLDLSEEDVLVSTPEPEPVGAPVEYEDALLVDADEIDQEEPLGGVTHQPPPGEEEQAPIKRDRKSSRKSRRERISFNAQVDEVREEGLRGLARFFNWWGKAKADTGHFFKNLFVRGRITEDGSLPELSLRTSLTIAIVVPLAVVGIAVGVYLSRGQTLQYQYYLEQAELAVANAQPISEPSQAREGYAQAVLFLDQAESYRSTDETTQLRAEIQRALDVLDGAVRLSFHPAIIGPLPEEINITRIISYGRDLYLLDAAGGRVIHATRASQGYDIDLEFVCSMGNFSGGAVDALVDMVPQPINNPYQAHILAADAIGNVIFCGPGVEPVVQALPPGEGGIGAVTRIASEGNLLYVLDPSAEAIRVYPSTNGQFLDSPTIYFGSAGADQKPALSTIVDLAVNGAELYLLRGDGLMVSCVASGLPDKPVACENPVDYVDGRPGKEDQPVDMPDSQFVSVLYTPPPDPAVNVLDAENADIFRFSLRFRLYQRMRSDFGGYEVLSPSATAFTIGVDRIAFVAFGHQVFYAYVE